MYAVKTTTDPGRPPRKWPPWTMPRKQLLKDIFWQMNEISSSTSTQTESIIETRRREREHRGNGHARSPAPICISRSATRRRRKWPTSSAFNDDQREQMAELLADENNSLWARCFTALPEAMARSSRWRSRRWAMWAVALLELVRLWQPCGMVRLLCELVCQ